MIEENEVPTEYLKEGALLATGVYSEERTRRRREIVLELDKKTGIRSRLTTTYICMTTEARRRETSYLRRRVLRRQSREVMIFRELSVVILSMFRRISRGIITLSTMSSIWRTSIGKN